jgi:branched-subunit amino acid transport protein
MRAEILLLALSVGACTWAFRYLPLRMDLGRLQPHGALARLLAATGAAAIATLFVASVLPGIRAGGLPLPLLAGSGAVLGLWIARRSVVLATLGGALVYGLATALGG